MRKVAVVAAVALRILVAPLAAAAQQPHKVPRIGYLGATSPSVAAPWLEAFRRGLRELGSVLIRADMVIE